MGTIKPLLIILCLASVPAHAFKLVPPVNQYKSYWITPWGPTRLSDLPYLPYTSVRKDPKWPWNTVKLKIRLQYLGEGYSVGGEWEDTFGCAVKLPLPGAPGEGVISGGKEPDLPIYCDGVYLGKEGEAPDIRNVNRVIKHLYEGRSVTFAGHDDVVGGWQATGSCDIVAQIGISKSGIYKYNEGNTGGCPDPGPGPISCTVSGPSEMVHPAQRPTGISGTVVGTWKLECSDPARVTVSTPSVVYLKSGVNTLETKLYVGKDGVTESQFSINGPTDVKILSKLTNPTASPGNYVGSGVVTVTWY